MTEWEQLKKEYREIPIPPEGPCQVLEAVSDARRKRSHWKVVLKYGSIAAAAILVVMILPGMFLFTGGAESGKDMASMEAKVETEEITADSGWNTQGSVDNTAENKITTPPEALYNDNYVANSGNSSKAEYGVLEAEKESASIKLSVRLISDEILSQMKERMQEKGETYYIKSEACPDGFELISEDQEYYVNEEGLLVIVFEAGEVAPIEQGTVEFIIPAEVALP